jgi:hypothetical protein
MGKELESSFGPQIWILWHIFLFTVLLFLFVVRTGRLMLMDLIN